VADSLQDWFEARGSDGFVLFESLPGQLELFVELVVPILQDRGVSIAATTRARPSAKISVSTIR
jgi:alkanesulfonate monooxygenase SsuD/methylene tetrahydromethanopterin reductase-like flavin-dependent oxidoreductase (luciferase family)